MKKLLFAIATIMVAVGAFADNQQAGYVKTRGRLDANGNLIPGQRLGNATVVLQSGSSVATDNNGDFILKIPSAKFYLKDIKKNGYIVSDPDILSKQYVCSANPLVLVLDDPTTQQDDKRESEDKLLKKLRKQLREREDELDALREEHKITQEQYQEALQKLYSDQESNVKFIAEMAERYSRIDFDQLDGFQRQIAALIQNGELTRADSLLRTKGSMEDREAKIKRILKANDEEEKELAERAKRLSESKKATEVLLTDYATDCHNRFELCMLKFENDSAAYWLEKRAALFPDNIDYQLEAGNFIKDYLANYSLSLDYFNKALNIAKDQYDNGSQSVATCYNNIGTVYDDQEKYHKALQYYVKALNIYLTISNVDNPDVATCYNNIGLTYFKMGYYAKATMHLEKALKIFLEIYGDSHLNVATCNTNLGLVNGNNGEYDKALEYYEKALNIWLEILPENHPNFANYYNNVGLVFYNRSDYVRALEYFKYALNIILANFDENHPIVRIIKDNIADTENKIAERQAEIMQIIKICEEEQ